MSVRAAMLDDAAELCALLNEIIAIGGTTALETALSEQEFAEYYLHGESYICCHVAVAEDGALAGFQALETHTRLPDDWADIATFARVSPKTPGVGSALFPHTLATAREHGYAAINATIRADNKSGLAYYDKMGFETYKVEKAVPLSDGTKVDRVSKQFDL
ncbi:MAG: GNAT family N-acetyltransferase [Hyphomicrobiales bacterium]